MEPSGKRSLSIDGLRGFGALYILFFHVYSVYGPYAFPGVVPVAKRLIDGGTVWVQFFFCVSGLLVYASLERGVANEENPARNYFIRRAMRVLPLWWLTVATAVLFGEIASKAIFPNFTMSFGFLAFNHDYTPIMPAWSLFVDLFFYLLLPLVFTFVRRLRGAFVLFALFTALSYVFKNFAGSWGVPMTNNFIIWSPLANLQYFFAGVALFHLGKIRSPFHILDAAVFAWALSLFFGPVWPAELVVPLVVAASVSDETLLSRILKNNFLRWAGVRCYCIYIFQSILVWEIQDLMSRLWHVFDLDFTQQVVPWIAFAVILPVSLAVAGLTFWCLERPCIRGGERIIAGMESKTRTSRASSGQLAKTVF